MIPRFEFTASIQPPTVNFDSSISDATDASKVAVNVSPNYTVASHDVICNIIGRLTRLEGAVFKDTDPTNGTEPERAVATQSQVRQLPLTDSQPETVTDTAWSVLVDAMGKRLDACAGQPSVNECVLSMRQLKRDLVSLSQALSEFKMHEKQLEAVTPFLEARSSPSEQSSEPQVKQIKKETTPWKAVISRNSVRPSYGTGYRQGPSNPDKKWGPCFYCTCTEWKPGHTCEGSRLAQQRKKERESQGS